MKYKITITKVKEVEVTEQGPYTVIDTRPWTKNEIGQQNFFGKSENDWIENNPVKEVRGYAPNRTIKREQETEVLKQTVETLDLAAVIKAVNGL